MEGELGVVVIVAYRPHKGKGEELFREVKQHGEVLRAEGLATSREPIVMRSKDGVVIEVFEWESHDAIAKAHESNAVGAMWARFSACCDYETLSNVPETNDLFASFEPLDLHT